MRRADAYKELAGTAWSRAATNRAHWETAAETFGGAYSGAYEKYVNAMAAKARADQLKVDVAVSLIGLVAGGALGSLATNVVKPKILGKDKNHWAYDFLAPIGTGLGGTAISAGKQSGQVDTGNSLAPVGGSPTNPTKFAAEMKIRVGNQFNRALECFQGHKEIADQLRFGKGGDVSVFKDWPVERIRTELNAEMSRLEMLQEPPAFDSPMLEDAFEIALWSKWVAGLRVKTKTHAGGDLGERSARAGEALAGISQDGEGTTINDPGNVVIDRLKALQKVRGDIMKLPSIDWNSVFDTSQSELGKLLEWGEKWRMNKTLDI